MRTKGICPSAWLALDDSEAGWPAEQSANVIITDPLHGIASPEMLSPMPDSVIRFSPGTGGRWPDVAARGLRVARLSCPARSH
jgi:hypothetical protein